MFRVLHLHPVQCDFQTRRCLQQLTRNIGNDFIVTAKSIGLGGDLHHLPGAVIALRAARPNRGQTIAHVWGPTELAAAALAGFPKIIFSPSSPVLPRWFPFLRKISRLHRLDIVCSTETLRRIFLADGIARRLCHLVRPAIDPSRIVSRPNPLLRGELGFADSDIVLLAPGESTRDGGHRQAAWAAGILNFVDPCYRLLTWGRGQAVDSLRRFIAKVRQDNVLVQAEPELGRRIEFEDLAGVADAALVFARGAVPTLAIAVCMAAGVPIVCNQTSALAEIVPDGTALAVAGATPRFLAQRVLDLRRDPAAQSQMIQAAQARARELFSAPRFLAEYASIYRQIAEDEN